MKFRNIHLLSVLIFLFSGCSKEEEQTSIPLQLTYPVSADSVSVCCFDFKWEPSSGNSYEFKLSEDENFTNLVVDTLVTASQFALPDTLAYNTRYYWKVKDGVTQQASSFITAPDPVIPSLTLLSPSNSTIVNPCCTNFQWDSNVAGSYRFKLSEQANFSSLLVDSTLSVKSLSVTKMLHPNKAYYWQVQAGNLTQSSSFSIKDIPAQFQGTYPNATIRKYNWSYINGVTSDTTFIGTVSLLKEGDNIRFVYAPDNINWELGQNTLGSGMNFTTIIYWNLYGPIASCWAKLNFSDGSFIIDNKSGGLGGGTVWKFTVNP